VVSPDQLPSDFRASLAERFPGAGEASLPIDPENWQIITDGMYQVTQPGLYHTAAAEGLVGIDFGGKTGTAQVMSHEALDKTDKGRATNPNVWFVGVTPTHNPELVVAVLFQNGNKSWFAARIGARVVSAYVEKQRLLAHNLTPPKTAPPVEMTALWTPSSPASGVAATPSGQSGQAGKIVGGKFLVKDGEIVPPATPKAQPGVQPRHAAQSASAPPSAALSAGSGKGQ
jgi:penicillin-binding protein 2